MGKPFLRCLGLLWINELGSCSAPAECFEINYLRCTKLIILTLTVWSLGAEVLVTILELGRRGVAWAVQL